MAAADLVNLVSLLDDAKCFALVRQHTDLILIVALQPGPGAIPLNASSPPNPTADVAQSG